MKTNRNFKLKSTRAQSYTDCITITLVYELEDTGVQYYICYTDEYDTFTLTQSMEHPILGVVAIPNNSMPLDLMQLVCKDLAKALSDLDKF